MSILPSEVQWYLSAPQAGAGFTQGGSPGSSLGKWMSTTQVNNNAPLDNLFTDITPAENAAEQIDYQCVFLMNNTITGYTLRDPFIWMPEPLWTFNGAALSVGVDPTGAVPYNSTHIQAASITNTQTPPIGVLTWVAQPLTDWQQGLQVFDLLPGYCIAIWIKRMATNSGTLTPQSLNLACTYQSPA